MYFDQLASVVYVGRFGVCVCVIRKTKILKTHNTQQKQFWFAIQLYTICITKPPVWFKYN